LSAPPGIVDKPTAAVAALLSGEVCPAAPSGADVQSYPSQHSLRNKLARFAWRMVWLVLYRPSPRGCHAWRRFLLRLFGAKIEGKAHPYPGAKIWAPWNLEMGHLSCLADQVDCYSVDKITIRPHAIVSQYSYLCTATHDYRMAAMPLTTRPILIDAKAWVCADVFVAPGVSIGEGAVVGARSSVFHDIEPWTIASGNPAKARKRRVMED